MIDYAKLNYLLERDGFLHIEYPMAHATTYDAGWEAWNAFITSLTKRGYSVAGSLAYETKASWFTVKPATYADYAEAKRCLDYINRNSAPKLGDVR